MSYHANPWGLTQRQMKILIRLSAEEHTIRIGAALGIGPVVIRTELNRIYMRLGVTNMDAAIRQYRDIYPLI